MSAADQQHSPDYGLPIGTVEKCRNCGERIILVNLAFGPTWRHQKAGETFNDGMHQFCHVNVAEPIVPSKPACQACGVELSEDGACWWCDDGPEPTAPLPSGSDGGVS